MAALFLVLQRSAAASRYIPIIVGQSASGYLMGQPLQTISRSLGAWNRRRVMYTDQDEAAYCLGRIERSTALAKASVDSCARASHVGIANAYGDRLTALTKTPIQSLVAAHGSVGSAHDV